MPRRARSNTESFKIVLSDRAAAPTYSACQQPTGWRSERNNKMPARATAVPLHTAISVNVREARPEDAEAMVRMVQALAEYQGIRPRVHAKAEDYRRDGFGPQRRFE